MPGACRSRQLRVLVAHLDTENAGNPDIVLIYDPAGPFAGAYVRGLNTRRLTLERWDIVHVYWPEWCIRRDAGTRTQVIDSICFLSLLHLARLRGAKVVWSANNLTPHEAGRLGTVAAYARAFTGLVDHLHATSDRALGMLHAYHPRLRATPATTAPLGHYRDHYRDSGLTRTQARERLGLPMDATIALSIGAIRPYKNIPSLIDAHRLLRLSHPGSYLLIAGNCTDPELRDEVTRRCSMAGNARADDAYIQDSEICCYLRAADFVVHAATSTLNSGSAMLALSFDRPILVSGESAMLDFSDRYGPNWVMTFGGDISASALAKAHARWGGRSGTGGAVELPGWSETASKLLAAFTRLTVDAE